jgi:hypothetical protein
MPLGFLGVGIPLAIQINRVDLKSVPFLAPNVAMLNLVPAASSRGVKRLAMIDIIVHVTDSNRRKKNEPPNTRPKRTLHFFHHVPALPRHSSHSHQQYTAVAFKSLRSSPYQAFTSKFSYYWVSSELVGSVKGKLTSGKYVVTTVRSANFLPANALSAFVAISGVSNLIKIFPTPADCLLPPIGLGILMARILPNFSHSSWTSSRISESC